MNRLEQIQTFLTESPNDPFLIYAMALEYLKIHNYDKALDIFEQLTENHPMYVGTYYHLGKLQEKLEQYDEALETYQEGMKVAQKLADRHSLNELQGAYNMLNDELMDW